MVVKKGGQTGFLGGKELQKKPTPTVKEEFCKDVLFQKGLWF